MENDIEPTVRQLVKLLAEIGERQNEITADQRAELRQAAEWLLPKPPPSDLQNRLVQGMPSSHLAHAIPYLEDVEVMKRSLIGTMLEHKGHTMTCHTQSEKFPAFSAEHDIVHVGSGRVLRIQFAVVVRIHDEGK